MAKKDELIHELKNEVLVLSRSCADLKISKLKLTEDMKFQVSESERKLEAQKLLTGEVLEIETNRLLEEIQSIKDKYTNEKKYLIETIQSLKASSNAIEDDKSFGKPKPTEMLREKEESEYIQEIESLYKIVHALQSELEIGKRIQKASYNQNFSAHSDSIENGFENDDKQNNLVSKTFTFQKSNISKASNLNVTQNNTNLPEDLRKTEKSIKVQSRKSLTQNNSNKLSKKRQSFSLDTKGVQEYKPSLQLGASLIVGDKPFSVQRFRSKSVPNKLNIKEAHKRYHSTSDFKDPDFTKYLKDYKAKYDIKLVSLINIEMRREKMGTAGDQTCAFEIKK